MTSQISKFKTGLAFTIILVIMIPVSMLVEAFLSFALEMSAWKTNGWSENIIPFNLFPEYGIPLMMILQSFALSFAKAFVPLLIVASIFRSSFSSISWITVCALYFAVFCLLMHILYGTEYLSVSKFETIFGMINFGVQIGISYFILFRKKRDLEI